ncbi:NAD(P)/FAD-dependent oxidoreductase [Pleionea sediminis]|uniref:NAD(P)/FAD-dependent oxidoreductase n=1 Tax=Pleionea sediminis TaxID=2569479 RepID=UPI001FE65225|nr:FAD-dependent oxidoreductase [Pleionea sediminis]
MDISDKENSCLIVGGSHAGAQLAISLRQMGWQGRIKIISEEAYLPYQRPPLSKALLAGKQELENVYIRPETLYEKQNIEFALKTRVAKINRKAKTVETQTGEIISYDKLALCTGARVRKLEICGTDLAGIHYLRNFADVSRIKGELDSPKKIFIVGGGYIGLEAAASLKQLNHEVTVVEAAGRVLQRVTAPQVSNFFHAKHHQQGVSIVTNKQVAEFLGNNKVVEKVVCTDGTVFEADLVIVGIGVRPNEELAAQAGLKTNNGIWVDEFAQTDDPDIVAAGDNTNHPNKLLDTRLRLESVPNAMEQAKAAAASICGKPTEYASLPWFWSDQYTIKLQIAGLNTGYDQVVLRGDPADGNDSFVAWYLKGGKLLAADCINRPKEFMFAKQLLAKKIDVKPEQLTNENFELKQLV